MDSKDNNLFSLNAFPEVKMFLLSALEELSNRALQYDEASRLAIQALAGQSLRIESHLPLSDNYFYFVILFCDKGLIFSAEEEAEADAVVRANNFITVARFFSGKFAYADNGDQTQRLLVEGDLALVNQLQDILSELDIDWEEPLSAISGDVVAHEVGRFANDAGEWVKKAGEFFEQELDGRLNNLSKLFFQKKQSVDNKAHAVKGASTVLSGDSFNQEIEIITDMQARAEQGLEKLESRPGTKEQ